MAEYNLTREFRPLTKTEELALRGCPRSIAKLAGEKWYTPKNPCRKAGHHTPRRTNDGYCVDCLNVRKEKFRNDPKNRTKIKTYQDAYNRENQLRLRTYNYGITPEIFEKMLHDQWGICKICKQPLKEGKFTHIDHCHYTGKIRGLLCILCNTGLGKFKDDVNLLKSAIAYLEESIV